LVGSRWTMHINVCRRERQAGRQFAAFCSSRKIAKCPVSKTAAHPLGNPSAKSPVFSANSD
jgi:hypothetical protein